MSEPAARLVCYLAIIGIAVIPAFWIDSASLRALWLLVGWIAGAALAERAFRRLLNRSKQEHCSGSPAATTVRYSGSDIIFTRSGVVVECNYSGYNLADDGRWYLEIRKAPAELSDDTAIEMILEGLAFRLVTRSRDAGIEIKRNGRDILNLPATDPPDNGGIFLWIFMKFVFVLLSPLILVIQLNRLITRAKNKVSKTPRSPPPAPPAMSPR